MEANNAEAMSKIKEKLLSKIWEKPKTKSITSNIKTEKIIAKNITL